MKKKWHKLRRYLSICLAACCMSGVTCSPGWAAPNGETTTITILGTSDVHGRFMPWDYAEDREERAGSLVQISTLVKEIRAENPNTILVDVGDSIQDNSVEQFNRDKEQPMVVAMNQMGYEIWTMGNHEFNFGLDVLEKVTQQFQGQVLCGNVYWENGQRFMPATKVIEKEGIRIGFIGMDTPMIAEFEKDSDHLDGVIVTDPVAETRKAMEELKGKADVLVGIIHMGVENENNNLNTGVADLAAACPELTAVIAGHMHQNISSKELNGVLVTEPDKYGRALSRIDLTFRWESDKPVLIERKAQTLPVASVANDEELEKILMPYHEKARAAVNVVIGEVVGSNLVPEDELKGISEVQIGDTPLTHLFNDVQLHYSGADVVSVIISRDNASMPVGPIRKKDIAFNYQYTGGETTVYEVRGRDLKDYMEWAAAYFNTLKPGDITPSYDPARRQTKYSTNDIFGGVTYEIDLTQPAGKRIKNLRLKKTGQEILDDDRIKLGMNGYRLKQLVAQGGPLEGRSFPQLWSSLEEFGENDGTIRNMTIRYIGEVLNGKVQYQPVDDWKLTGYDKNSTAYQKVVQLLREGKLSVHNSEDGKYTNIRSINVQELE